MGLDIAFNKELALTAGLETKKHKRGTEAEIFAAKQEAERLNSWYEASYVDYLATETTLIKVPNRDFYVEDAGYANEIVVRANKWGDTYAPLTEWLKEKGITWSEF